MMLNKSIIWPLNARMRFFILEINFKCKLMFSYAFYKSSVFFFTLISVKYTLISS